MGKQSRLKRERVLARQQAERVWDPFVPAEMNGEHVVTIVDETFRVFRNNRYTVLVRRITFPPEMEWPNMVHLSIKRNDKEAIHDWRDLQRIKNELVGPNNEGVELYPSEERLVDGANQYHLYVFVEAGVKFPFGYGERMVTEGGMPGTKQRPFPPDNRPADLRTKEEIMRAKEALERRKL